MKKYYFTSVLFLLAFSFSGLNAQNTSVYVAAHPDDWQLFMNPNAYNSLKTANEKIIFIHTTSGDGGAGVGTNFYSAREEGSLRAIRFMSNTFTNAGALGTNMNKTTVTINGHSVLKYTYRNAVAYFLRLPDGDLSGNGYPGTNNVSIKKLINGSISSITAINNTTTYSSLDDLKNTIQSIVQSEATPSGAIKFNLADSNETINPYDHADHLYSSVLMQGVAANIGGVTLNLYSEYNSGNMPENVFGSDLLINAGTWGATASGISDSSSYSTWDNTHNVWVTRQYFRTVLPNNTPIATITATDAIAAENPLDTGTYTISLNAINQGAPISINYAVAGTAAQATDYLALSGTVNIPTGSQNATVTLTPIDDSEVEQLENVILTLTSGTGYISGNPNSATITIESDDVVLTTTNIAMFKPATASSGIASASKAFDNNYSRSNYWAASPYSQWIQVDLQNVYDLNKVVVFTYYGGTRYYQYDIQASLDGSTWTKIVDYNQNTVPQTSDGNSFVLNNAKARYLRINMNYNTQNAAVHVIEFEAYGTLSPVLKPIASIVATDSEASENPLDSGAYTVSLNAPNNGAPLTVDYTVGGNASPSIDYTALSGSVVILTGQQSANIVVTPINDAEVESVETVVATLTANSNYTIGASSSATINITSEDVAPPVGNIALNKATSASLTNERPSSNAVDANYAIDNWWAASPYPQWWQVDLGNTFALNKVVVFTYYDGLRYYQYDVQSSLDGINWTTIVDFNTNVTVATNQGNTFNLSNPSARYLRVNMNFNSSNVGVHIIEFEAYGDLINPLAGKNSNQNVVTFMEKETKPLAAEDFSLTINPNPAKRGEPLSMKVNSSIENAATMEIYNLGGSKLAAKNLNIKSGTNLFEIPLDHISSGMLLIKVTIADKTIIKKVLIE